MRYRIEDLGANIMDALTVSARPLSAYDLLDQLRPTGVVAPLTVYRALDKLIKSGKVHRIESLNAFVACTGAVHHDHAHAEPGDHTIAFTICDACGAVEEFADPTLCDAILKSVSGRSFSLHRSALEIHGLCGACGAV